MSPSMWISWAAGADSPSCDSDNELECEPRWPFSCTAIQISDHNDLRSDPSLRAFQAQAQRRRSRENSRDVKPGRHESRFACEVGIRALCSSTNKRCPAESTPERYFCDGDFANKPGTINDLHTTTQNSVLW